jgi:hypothetical protein
MPKPISGMFKPVDNLKKVLQGIDTLTNMTVLVGVPGEKTGRKDGSISNAALAYIHDKGAPEANIPARPFMEPGVKAVQKEITKELEDAGKVMLKGSQGSATVMRYLTRVGIITTRSIKAKITEGIPPPLAPSTIRGRIARVKGKARRKKIDAAIAAGTPLSRQSGAEGIFTPLIVTGQLRNAITYVIRKLKKGK